MGYLDTWTRGYLIKHNTKKEEKYFPKSQHVLLKVIYELKNEF